jgi:hypothetical protein
MRPRMWVEGSNRSAANFGVRRFVAAFCERSMPQSAAAVVSHGMGYEAPPL